MSRYARLVTKHRRLLERFAAQAGPDLLEAIARLILPSVVAAQDAVGRVARDPAWQAEHGGELVMLYGEAATRRAREIAARTLAAIELAGVTACPHLDVLPQGEVHSVILLGYRRIACPACARALNAAGVEPDPADADRCDFCGTRGITRFSPMVLPLGPSVVFGDACPACHRALVPGRPVRPAGRG
jgi:hypothetical protein